MKGMAGIETAEQNLEYCKISGGGVKQANIHLYNDWTVPEIFVVLQNGGYYLKKVLPLVDIAGPKSSAQKRPRLY